MLKVSHDLQTRYDELRRRGESHNMALLLASRTPPGTGKTDKAYLQGRQNDEDFGAYAPHHKDMVLKMARKAGVSVRGKAYCSQAASYPGDPKAWVSDRGEAMTRISQRQDELKREAEKPDVKLSDELISHHAAQYREQHPLMSPGEMREMIIDKHGPK